MFSRKSFVVLVLLLGGSVTARAQGVWALTGRMDEPRFGHTATFLPNGKVLVAGGSNGRPDGPGTAELYDPGTGIWTATSPLAFFYFEDTATLLPSGKVLVVGASCELYDPSTATWTVTSPLAQPRAEHTATLLKNGKILVVGGVDVVEGIAHELASAELYNPSTEKWMTTGSLAAGRGLHTATLLADGKVLVVGGSSADKKASSSAEIYDPESGRWTETGSLAGAREFHTATLLLNGNVLVAGGAIDNMNELGLAAAELYDPVTGRWTAADSMATAHKSHTATLLPSGRVLVAGGTDQQSFDSAEIYDPASGKWASAGSPLIGGFGLTATLLPGGSVLAVGGATAVLYEPEGTGTWTETSPATTPPSTATLLPYGKVLVVGGSSGGSVSSAELYDPATGNWKRTGPLLTDRYDHTATLLQTATCSSSAGPVSTATTSPRQRYTTAPRRAGRRRARFHLPISRPDLGIPRRYFPAGRCW